MSWRDELSGRMRQALGIGRRFVDPMNITGNEEATRLVRGVAHEVGPGTLMAAPGLYAMGAGAVGAVRDRGSEASRGFGGDFIDNMQYEREDVETMRSNPIIASGVQRYHEAAESGDDDTANALLGTLEQLGVDPRGRSSMQFVNKVNDWGRNALGLEDQTTAEEAGAVVATALLPAPKFGLLGKLANRAPQAARPGIHVAGRATEVMLPGSSPYTPTNVGLNAAVPLAIGEALTRASGEDDGFVGPLLDAVTREFDDIMSPVLEWQPPARDSDGLKTANHVTGYDMFLRDPEGDE